MDKNIPGFDLWTSLFLFFALLGLCISCRLLVAKKRHAPFLWLGLIVLAFALTVAEWVLWWTGYINMVSILKGFSHSFPFFIGVLILGYYQSAFPASNLKEKQPSFWHYLPGLLYFIKISPMYLWSLGLKVPDWGRFTFITRQLDGAFYVMLLHFAFYPIWIYRRYLPFLISDPEMLRWHRWLLVSYCGIVTGYAVHHVLTLLGWMDGRLDFLIAACIVVFMLFVGYLGSMQRHILAGKTFFEAIIPIKYRKSVLTEQWQRHIHQCQHTVYSCRADKQSFKRLGRF
jgi:hypothetical protein